MHGRVLRTKLDVASAHVGRTDDAPVRDRVRRQQHKQKTWWDKRNGVRVPQFGPGDWVRCELMPRPRKGRPRFSQPRRVAQQTGPATYRLDDGTRVHAERLTGAPDVPDAGATDAVGPTAHHAGADADDSGSSDGTSVAESVATDAGGGDGVGSDGPGGSDDTEDVEARGAAAASDVGETGAAVPVRSGGVSGARAGVKTTVVTRSGRIVQSPDRLGFPKRRGINVVY